MATSKSKVIWGEFSDVLVTYSTPSNTLLIYI